MSASLTIGLPLGLSFSVPVAGDGCCIVARESQIHQHPQPQAEVSLRQVLRSFACDFLSKVVGPLVSELSKAKGSNNPASTCSVSHGL